MVFALAGDSTMTRDEPPAPSAPLSISVTTFFFVRFFATGFRAAMSVHRFRTFRDRRRKASTLDQRAQIIERDAPVDLHQSTLDELFQLRRRHHTRARQGQQLAPRLG